MPHQIYGDVKKKKNREIRSGMLNDSKTDYERKR